jgi:hypothetical protein
MTEIKKRIELAQNSVGGDVNVFNQLVVAWRNDDGPIKVRILDAGDIKKLFEDNERHERVKKTHHSKRRILHDL